MLTQASSFSAFTQLRLRKTRSSSYRDWSISLPVCIGFAFSAVIAVLGTVLITYSYERNRDAALVTAAELFDHITLQTAGNIGELYAPIESLVNLTSSLPSASIGAASNLPELLSYFVESLRKNAQLSSIYVGYDSGDFYLVRSILGSSRARKNFASPDSTAFIVQRIDRSGTPDPRYTTLYYDKALRLLDSKTTFVTGYDPRTRGWFQRAKRVKNTIVTDFYLFFTTGEIGTTISRRIEGGNAVVGADLTLHNISKDLGKLSLSPATEIVVFSQDGTVLGYRDDVLLAARSTSSARDKLRAPHISDLGRPVLNELFQRFADGTREDRLTITVDGENWYGSIKSVLFGPHRLGRAYMAVFEPERELLSNLNKVRISSALFSLLALALALLCSWWLSRRIGLSTRTLVSETTQIRQFNLDSPISTRSRISEIDELARSMAAMKTSIRQFTRMSVAITVDQSIDSLAEMVVRETCSACNASHGALWLMSDDMSSLDLIHEQSFEHTGIESAPTRRLINAGSGEPLTCSTQNIAMSDADGSVRKHQAEVLAVMDRESVIVDDIVSDSRFNVTASPSTRSMLMVPLITADGLVVGLLQMSDSQASNGTFDSESLEFIEALTSSITVALENQRLLKSHHDIFESLIQVMAVATDAKSPHTSGHCQRVPVLTSLLAEAAGESRNTAFAAFELTEAVRRELYIASWLHDCGKVTTPEHVVDKATKLETVYNRIHEIRTRFEVLLRDAQIRYYRSLLEHEEYDEAMLQEQLSAEVAQLHNDFALIAECNIGTESMAPWHKERLDQIAERTWLRHFDNSIGLSMEETERLARTPASPLPTHESLLADRDDHRVLRKNADRPWGDNLHGFRMDVPEYEYNFGEIYNLNIERGTLSAEERFKVNDHIVQTHIMLSRVPFPRELQRVPAIAGNHHEKLDGSGFPRRLKGASLGIEDRIMVVADIFEALTAADRPYKKAKNLSESIRIMSGMVDSGFICPDVFDLFLESKVYVRYASDYLNPWQIDTLDFSQYTVAAKMNNKTHVG